jgi:gliding motility-associated-like protein
MCKYLLVVFFFTNWCNHSLAQQNTCIDTVGRNVLYVPNANISIYDNAKLKDGSTAFTGLLEFANGDSLLYLAAINTQNNMVFSYQMQTDNIKPQHIKACKNGDILLTALKRNNNNRYLLVFRFTATGVLLWQKEFLIPYSTSYDFQTIYIQDSYIIEDVNQQIYIGINHHNLTTDVFEYGYIKILKLSAAGNLEWFSQIGTKGVKRIQILDIAIHQENMQIIALTNIGCANVVNYRSLVLYTVAAQNGNLLASKTQCLNLTGTGCGVANDENRFTGKIEGGSIQLFGAYYACGTVQNYIVLEMDTSMQPKKSFLYQHIIPDIIYNINTHISSNGNYNFLSSASYPNQFFYGTILKDGTILRTRANAVTNSNYTLANYATNVYNEKEIDQYRLWLQVNMGASKALQLTQFNEEHEKYTCIGSDSAFLKKYIHQTNLVAVLFISQPSTIITNNSNYSWQNATILQTMQCQQISNCSTYHINGPDTVCLNNALQTYKVSRNAGCYKKPLWQIDTAVIAYIQNVNDTTVEIKFKKAWQGYLYSYSNMCSFIKDSIFITVLAAKEAVHIGNDTTFCTPFIVNAGLGYKNYLWQNGSNNATYNITQPGVYWVQVQDYCGNTYSDTLQVYTKRNQLNLGNDTSLCTTSILLNVGTGFKNYLWQNGSIDATFTVTQPGIYYVKAINYCNEVFNDTIQIFAIPNLPNLGNDFVYCPGKSYTLQAPPNYKNYLWSTGAISESIIVNNPGIYYVRLIDYCNNITSDTIAIKPTNYTFEANTDTSICLTDVATLTATAGYTNYLWLPNNYINNNTLAQVVVNPNATITYMVSAEVFPNCRLQDTVTVYIKNCPEFFYMPTAFTPNNDGINDFIKPIIGGVITAYEFVIYNRWGQKIFSTSNKQNGWNGKLNSTLQANDSFVWICKYTTTGKKQVLKKGTLICVK